MTGPDALSAAASAAPPLSRFAGQIVTFAAPLMRIRYPAGVYVDIAGFPTWIRYARAVIEFEHVDHRLAGDVLRITRVLAANRLMATSGDPLWQPPEAGEEEDDDSGVVPTPDGWAWVHFAHSGRVGLLPAELATAFRHWGGIATSGVPHGGGVTLGPGHGTAPVEFTGTAAGEEELAKLEQELGHPLPAPYRGFLATHNGGRPVVPVVHPESGFVLDQSLFQVGGKDYLRGVSYMRRWLSDRFTDDYLAIGRVQGGMLALRLTGPDAGSVWFWDADDVRDHDRYDARVVSRDLLRRCDDSFDAFLQRLMPVRGALSGAAQIAAQYAHQVSDPRIGTALPVKHRPPAGLAPVRPQRDTPAIDEPWEAVRDRLRPVLRAATYGLADELEHGARALSRPALPFLRELVVVDYPDRMAYVMPDHAEKWGIDPDQLFDVARANLAAAVPPPRPPDGGSAGGVMMPFVGVDYAEALPLLDGWLAACAEALGGRPLAFMAGHGELLLVTADDDNLAGLLDHVAENYRDSERPLSPMAYTVDDTGALVPYPALPGHPAESALLRTMATFGAEEYAHQKAAFDEHHERFGTDLFVASVMLQEREGGLIQTVSVWGDGVDTLLPRTHQIAFASDDDEPFIVPWEVVTELLPLVPEPGMDPPRYRVRGWPPPELIAQLRSRAV